LFDSEKENLKGDASHHLRKKARLQKREKALPARSVGHRREGKLHSLRANRGNDTNRAPFPREATKSIRGEGKERIHRSPGKPKEEIIDYLANGD